jgi:hypothetical protein
MPCLPVSFRGVFLASSAASIVSSADFSPNREIFRGAFHVEAAAAGSRTVTIVPPETGHWTSI